MRIPRRFLNGQHPVVSSANRDSEYSAISENEIWQRQHEDEEGTEEDGITTRYHHPNRNSTKSGMFDLELELAASTRASRLQEEQQEEGDSLDMLPPPSPGCGLGITSDDAIHPEHTYAPAVARAPISPAIASAIVPPPSSSQQANIPLYSDSSLECTRHSGYFGQQPNSVNNYAAGEATSPQSVAGTPSSYNGSPHSSVYVHGGHTPGLDNTIPTSGTSSRWNTSRNYVRRNTGSSIRGGLYKAPSQQSLRDSTSANVFPQLQEGSSVITAVKAVAEGGKDTPQASISGTRGETNDLKRIISRTNSLVRPVTTIGKGVGIAGIDTISPAEHSISSSFSPSGTSTSSTSFTRLQKGRTRSRGPSLSTYSNTSSSSPYQQDQKHVAEGDARFSYAESATSMRTRDSYISTTSTNDNEGDSRRSSMLSNTGGNGTGHLYELENELEEILLSNGEMGTFNSLSPTTTSSPALSLPNANASVSFATRNATSQALPTHGQAGGLGLMSFQSPNGAEDRISKEIEAQAVHLAESGRGKIVELAKGQLIENLHVPIGELLPKETLHCETQRLG